MPHTAPTKPSLLTRLLLLGLIIGACIIGTGFMSHTVKVWRLSQDAPTFKSSEGTITRATTRNEGKDRLPDIRYEYKVDGATYTGDNHLVAPSFRDAKLAARAANRWDVGQQVDVFYDAETPKRSTLHRDVPMQRAYVRGAYGLVFYGVALFIVFAYWRSRKRSRMLAYAKNIEQRRQRELEESRKQRERREAEAAASDDA